jgi:hypothetical protein
VLSTDYCATNDVEDRRVELTPFSPSDACGS